MKTNREAVLARLAEDGIAAVPGALSPMAVRLRAGGRLSWEGTLGDVTLKPFVQASLWRENGAIDRTVYNHRTTIASGSATRGADVDLGLEAVVSDSFAIWASAGVTRDLRRPEGNANRNAWRLKAGLRYQW